MRYLGLVLVLAMSVFGWAADNPSAANKELTNATEIIQDMTGPSANAGIPDAVLRDAKCIAVVPHEIQGGFIIGGSHGAGIATCRINGNHWSEPAPFELTGVSWGLQIGGRSVDLIMMVMNDEGMQALQSGHFKLGAEVSGAAGPVGREASANAGWKAAILTYSRNKGAYAGATINGAELNQDHKTTKAIYGSDVGFKQILNGNAPKAQVAEAHTFMNTIQHAERTATASNQ